MHFPRTPLHSGSLLSHIGLNAANFFLAEMVGVILPFLSTFLKSHNWGYGQIGCAVALAGLGTLLFQIPAGVLSDEITRRRLLLAVSAIVFGVSFAMLPLFPQHIIATDVLLFLSGMASTFFVPLLAALALSLAGPKGFDHLMGVNLSWNHAGNIAAALTALLLVKIAGITSIFYVIALVSFLAVGSLLLINGNEVNPQLGISKVRDGCADRSFRTLLVDILRLFRDSRIVVLVVCVALFHVANAPTMPLVALYLKHLGAADDKTAWVVLIAQTVMVPVALLTAHFCASFGRKPVLAVAFLVLPLRILLYSLTQNPTLLLAIQALDGVSAGIYGVAICLICSDLTRGKAGFNTLLGVTQTALAMGGVVGPMLQGWVTQHLGFPETFITLAGIAALGAVLFIVKMPETKTHA